MGHNEDAQLTATVVLVCLWTDAADVVSHSNSLKQDRRCGVVTRPRGGWVWSPVLGVEEEWAMSIKSDSSRQSPWLDENLSLY